MGGSYTNETQFSERQLLPFPLLLLIEKEESYMVWNCSDATKPFRSFLRQMEGVEFQGNGPAPLSWGTKSSVDSSDLTAQGTGNREEVTCTEDYCETTSEYVAIKLLRLLLVSWCLCRKRKGL